MTRRTLVLAALLAGLIGAAMTSTGPAGASHTQDLAPASIDPHLLRIPDAKLPAGAHIDYEGVSDNADADGRTIPPGNCPSNGGPCQAQLHQVHQQFYELEGRVTGYRMDMSYSVNGTLVGTEYLGSIYGSTAQVTAAMNGVTNQNSILISIFGAKPLPDACRAGDECKAYYGPNPLAPSKEAVFGLFRRGQILVETGSQVPKDQFAALEPQLETTLYAMLDAADTQAQTALGMKQPTASSTTPTAVPTTTTSQPTAVPTQPTETPTPSFSFTGLATLNGSGKKVSTTKAGKQIKIKETWTVRNAQGTIPIAIRTNFQRQNRGKWAQLGQPLNRGLNTSAGTHSHADKATLSRRGTVRIVVQIKLFGKTQTKQTTIRVT